MSIIHVHPQLYASSSSIWHPCPPPQVQWSSCNIFSTQDHAAAAIAKAGIPGNQVYDGFILDVSSWTSLPPDSEKKKLNRVVSVLQCMHGKVRQMRSTCGASNKLCTSEMVSHSTWSWMMEEIWPTWSTRSTPNCWQVCVHTCRHMQLAFFMLTWV